MRSYFFLFLCLLALNTGGRFAHADDFENALLKTSLLSAACIDSMESKYTSLLDDDPDTAKEFLESINEGLAIYGMKDKMQKEHIDPFQEKTGCTDPHFLIRIATASELQRAEFFWRVIQKASTEMLRRLPALKSTRKTAEPAFSGKIVQMLKFLVWKSSNSTRNANLSSEPKVLEFVRALEAINAKVSREEPISTEIMQRYILLTSDVFYKTPSLYEDYVVFVELLEVYNLFLNLKGTKKTPQLDLSLLESAFANSSLSEGNTEKLRSKASKKLKEYYAGKTEELPPEEIPLLAAIKEASSSKDEPRIGQLMSKLLLKESRTIGKGQAARLYSELMSEIPVGSFLNEKAPKQSTRNKAPRKKKEHNSDLFIEEAISIPAVTEKISEPTDFILPEATAGELGQEGEELIPQFSLEDYIADLKARYKDKKTSSSNSAPSAPETNEVKLIRLTDGAARIFAIAAGHRFREYQVRNRDLLDFLRQVRGGLIGDKGNGSAKGFLLPNLRDDGEGPYKLYLLHWRHNGSDPFNPKTLRYRLGSALLDAGLIGNDKVKIEWAE